MMKRVFIVAGAEASGTHLVASILVNHGCIDSDDFAPPPGQAGEDGLWYYIKNNLPFPPMPAAVGICFRLSFPMGLDDPNLSMVLWQFKCLGYNPMALVTMRDWRCITGAHLADNTQARSKQHSDNKKKKAYCDIFHPLAFSGDEYIIISYESLVSRPQSVSKWMVEACGLKFEKDSVPLIYDGNSKYYDEA